MFDISKIKSRQSNFEINNHNPSICYYNPNYKYLNKNIAGRIIFILAIRFKKKEKSKHNKFFLIQKLWRSYNVSSDYKTVQLESYINENMSK